MAQQNGRGCGGTFMGCLGAGILITAIIGAALYFVVPRILKDADKKFIPWIESKGRVLAGKVALAPLNKIISRSELSKAEKKEWKSYIAEKWELAHSSHDKELSREALINISRATVSTYSGSYYALLAIGDRDFKKTSLTDKQINAGQAIITTVTANMLDGVYSDAEIKLLGPDLNSVLSGWRVDSTNEQGKRERDSNLRNFFRSLDRMTQKKSKSLQTRHSLYKYEYND